MKNLIAFFCATLMALPMTYARGGEIRAIDAELIESLRTSQNEMRALVDELSELRKKITTQRYEIHNKRYARNIFVGLQISIALLAQLTKRNPSSRLSKKSANGISIFLGGTSGFTYHNYAISLTLKEKELRDFLDELDVVENDLIGEISSNEYLINKLESL